MTFNPDGIILSGGPSAESVTERQVFALRAPEVCFRSRRTSFLVSVTTMANRAAWSAYAKEWRRCKALTFALRFGYARAPSKNCGL